MLIGILLWFNNILLFFRQTIGFSLPQYGFENSLTSVSEQSEDGVMFVLWLHGPDGQDSRSVKLFVVFLGRLRPPTMNRY